MKLHFSSQSAASCRYKKVKSVINALKAEVTEVPHQGAVDLTNISVFNILPLLETPNGSFFSTNTIMRYLASISGNKLYGGDNIFHKALIDQWMDITTCDLEAAVCAIAIAKEGKEVDASKILTDLHKFLKYVEQMLTGKKFLVGESVSLADYTLSVSLSSVLTVLGEVERKEYPNTVAWYLSLVQLDSSIGSKDLPKEAHKAFKKNQKKEEKKEVKKEEKKDQFEDDLFGDEEQAAPKEKVKAKVVVKQKKKAVAKSIITFDVKVYEQEQDLNELFKKIKKQIVMDGLVWNNDIKILPVAFGMNKLQMGCVVEDDKISTDDVFEKIQSWEDEVQSCDIVSFNKL